MSLNPKSIIQYAEIPSIPSVLHQILSLADNPRTSSADLERYVTQEPALAAQLLKWVNSAAYALPQRVSSIAHAMILLGFSTVKSIASGMVLINAFDRVSGLSKEFIHQVWRHTLSAAALIKIFSKGEANSKKDDFFLAAMIHDVGYMVMKQYFHEKYDKLLATNPFPTVEAEDKALEINHAVIGAELLREWKFSEKVIDMVLFHHDLENYKGDKKDWYFLHVCDDLAHNDDLPAFFEQKQEDLAPELLADLQKIGWTWPKVLSEKENFIEAIEMIDNLFG